MDKHIFMSFLAPSGFKILASNYLGISNHDMFDEIQKLVTELKVTPAEVAKELMKTEDIDAALGGLIQFLKGKMTESVESKGRVKKEVNCGEENGKEEVNGNESKEAKGKENEREESKEGNEEKVKTKKKKARKAKSRN